MDRHKWAQETAGHVRERRKQDILAKAGQKLDERLAREHAPELWMRVRDALREQTELLVASLGEPEALVYKSEAAERVLVETKSRRAQISASFNAEKLAIDCHLPNAARVYKAQVIDEEVEFVTNSSRQNPDEIAQDLLGALTPFI